MSAIISNMSSFSYKEYQTLAVKAFIFTFPGYPLLEACTRLFFEIHPQFLENDSLEESDSTSFIITKYDDPKLNQVANLFITKLDQDLSKGGLEERFMTYLKSFQELVPKLANEINLHKIDVNFSFCDSSDARTIEPYTANGGQIFSYFSNPFIKIHLDPRKVSIALKKEILPLSSLAKKFLIAHEISHIASDHTLAKAVVTGIYGLFNSFFWVESFRKGDSRLNTFCTVFIAAFIFQLALCSLSRYQEKQADLMACNVLKSNEEGLEFFEGVLKSQPELSNQIDLEHPPISKRIEYLREWKKKED